MKEKSERLSRWTRRIATLIIWLVLISLWLVVGLYARYYATDNRGQEARVVNFEVGVDSALMENLSLTLQPQSEAVPYAVSIRNQSEVPVRAEVTLELWGNLPLLVVTPGNTEEIQIIENTLSPKVGTQRGREHEDPIVLTWWVELPAGGQQKDDVVIGWTEEEGYAGYGYERGVEAIRLTVETKQIS
jgi:hypothetical protein